MQLSHPFFPAASFSPYLLYMKESGIDQHDCPPGRGFKIKFMQLTSVKSGWIDLKKEPSAFSLDA
jgi:hypothetical protein